MRGMETSCSPISMHRGASTVATAAGPAARLPSRHDVSTSATLRALVRAMPKAELHLHLDGSLRIDTALDIARTRDVEAPHTFAGMRGVARGAGPGDRPGRAARARSTSRSRSCRTPTRSSGSRTTWSRTRRASNVRYAEVRWAPLLHTDKGLTGRQVVEAVVEGVGAGGPPDGHRGPADRHADALAPARAEPRVRAAASRRAASRTGSSPSTSPAPRRASRTRSSTARRSSSPRSIGPPRHRPRRRVGRRGAGAAVAAVDAGADRPRAARDRGPGVRRGARSSGASSSTCARRRTPRRTSSTTFEAFPLKRLMDGRRPGHAQHRRPHGLRRHPRPRSTSGPSTRLGRHACPELWDLDLAAIEYAFCDERTKDRLRESFLAWGAGVPELFRR